MEALQLKVENLGWEISRLDAENNHMVLGIGYDA